MSIQVILQRMWRVARVLSLGLPGFLLWIGLAAAGTTVYQCRGSNGQLAYQDSPCGAARAQQRLVLPDSPPTLAPVVAPGRQPEPPINETSPQPSPAQPAAAVPRMYGCVNAVDGKPYVSKRGDPAPYLAPYGTLGAGQLTLSEAYGPTRGGAGMSAPEANRGRVTTALATGNYVWVQDRCRELTVQETCAALRDDLERNAHALDKAFRSDRPPLEQRDRQLRAQLRGC